jgi:hypothetical protein
MHMWHHVTNHLIISNDKDSNSENRIKLRIRDTVVAIAMSSMYIQIMVCQDLAGSQDARREPMLC